MQVILRIPIMEMDMDKIYISIIEEMAKLSASRKVARHARKSMRDVLILQKDHPLRTVIKKINTGSRPQI